MQNKLSLYQYISSNSNENGKDILIESIIEDKGIIQFLFKQDLNINALCCLHLILQDQSPVSNLLASEIHNNNIQSNGALERQYFNYLQKVSSIHDLYQAIQNEDIEKMESLQLYIMTAHKIQNLSNMGLVFLTLPINQLLQMQKIIYNDLVRNSEFMKQHFLQFIDEYATQSSSLILSLYQIYTDILVLDAELIDFSRQVSHIKLPQSKKFEITDHLLNDFLSLSSSLMQMDANTLKPLNIPTKMLPCGGKEKEVLRHYRKFYSIG